MFALIVHTIQTFEVILLGAYGWFDLTQRQKRRKIDKPTDVANTPPTANS